MYCTKCGNQIRDDSIFCEKCGNRIDSKSQTPKAPPKIMLNPDEVVEHKENNDTSKTFRGQGKIIGLILMILSILGDLVSMFVIGFDSFIPITIGATVLFVVGFLLRMFSP